MTIPLPDLSIPLIVDVPAGLHGKQVPLRFSVPLLKGELATEFTLYVDRKPSSSKLPPPRLGAHPKIPKLEFSKHRPDQIPRRYFPSNDYAVAATHCGTTRYLPTRIDPVAPWGDKPGDGVRWLAIETIIDVDQHQPGTRYELVKKPSPPIHRPVSFQSLEDGVLRVETGAASFDVHTQGVVGLSNVMVGPPSSRESLVKKGDSSSGDNKAKSVLDHVYTSGVHNGETSKGTFVAFGKQGSWIVESQSKLHLALRISGVFQDSADTDCVENCAEDYCQFILRLEFNANSAEVKILHTLIYDGNSDDVEAADGDGTTDGIGGLRLEIPLDLPIWTSDSPNELRKKTRLGISTDDPEAFFEHADTNIALVQSIESLSFGPNRHALRQNIVENSGALLPCRGSGWIDFGNSQKRVTIKLRDSWQNYPCEFEVEDGSVKAHLWPAHHGPLDFSAKEMLGRFGNADEIDDYLAKSSTRLLKEPIVGQDPPKINDPTGTTRYPSSAWGLAKSHELTLAFQRADFSASFAGALTRAVDHPVFACATPAWTAKTNALGPLEPWDHTAEPDVEACLDAMFDRYLKLRDQFMAYGWIDYGEVFEKAAMEVNHSSPDSATYQPDETDIYPPAPHPYRMWNSAHYGFPNAAWILFFRSGNRKYFEFASANTRHITDIDFCHLNSAEKPLGSHGTVNSNIVHWSGDRRLRDYYQLEFMAYSYYAQADYRSLEVFREWGESMAHHYPGEENGGISKTAQNEAKLNDPAIWPEQAPGDLRHIAPPIGNLIELARATWKAPYAGIVLGNSTLVSREALLEKADLLAVNAERYLRLWREALQTNPAPSDSPIESIAESEFLTDIKASEGIINKERNPERHAYIGSGKVQWLWDALSSYFRDNPDKNPCLRKEASLLAQRSLESGMEFSVGAEAFILEFGNSESSETWDSAEISPNNDFVASALSRIREFVSLVDTDPHSKFRGCASVLTGATYPWMLRTVPRFLALLKQNDSEENNANLIDDVAPSLSGVVGSNHSMELIIAADDDNGTENPFPPTHLEDSKMKILVGDGSASLTLRLGPSQAVEMLSANGWEVRESEIHVVDNLNFIDCSPEQFAHANRVWMIGHPDIAPADATWKYVRGLVHMDLSNFKNQELTLRFPPMGRQGFPDGSEHRRVTLLNAEGIKLVATPSSKGRIRAFAPRLYFRIPSSLQGNPDMRITLVVPNPWSGVGWAPKITLYRVDSNNHAISVADFNAPTYTTSSIPPKNIPDYPGKYAELNIAGHDFQAGELWCIGPFGRVRSAQPQNVSLADECCCCEEGNVGSNCEAGNEFCFCNKSFSISQSGSPYPLSLKVEFTKPSTEGEGVDVVKTLSVASHPDLYFEPSQESL